jgi:hypothetical protein
MQEDLATIRSQAAMRETEAAHFQRGFNRLPPELQAMVQNELRQQQRREEPERQERKERERQAVVDAQAAARRVAAQLLERQWGRMGHKDTSLQR